MKFSLIVVCLNPGKKLAETLQSALKQSYQNFEIVIKDGGSTDGSLESVQTLLSDERIRLYQEPDKGIYDAMNQAVQYVKGEFVFFLNCGDSFHDNDVLKRVSERIEAETDREKLIVYGKIFGLKNQVWITPAPLINGFTCYRNVPCHQACFYSTALCKEKSFDLSYKIRGDYEHFLWCFYRAKAKCVYLDMAIADYEGGGYSETKANLKRSKEEHRVITKEYMSAKELLQYRTILFLTLAPLRTFLSNNAYFSGAYNKIRDAIYRARAK